MAIRRKILDDLFDAFSLIAGTNYVSLYDAKGQMTRYSKAYVDMFGLPGEYIEDGADDWTLYIHPEDRERYTSTMTKLLSGEATTYNLTYRVRLVTGEYGLFRFIGAILRTEDNTPELVGGVTINEGLLEHTDPITVLRNQYGFFNDLVAVIEMQKKNVVLMLGISKLSEINETYGYGYGNHVLQEVAWVIQEHAGQYGTIYRLNGAKFAVMTDQISPVEIEDIYENIRQRLLDGVDIEDTRQTVILNGSLITVGENRMNENSVMSCLRYAYRESKVRSHGKIVAFDEATGNKHKDLLMIIDAIRDSVIRDCKGFSVKYQPVFSVNDNKATGLEALLRWSDEAYGDVEPSVFIPILERDFIFEELGYWIIETVMKDSVRFFKKNPNLKISINIASVQIEDDFFIEEIQNLSNATGFPLENLIMELSKDCRQLDKTLLSERIRELRKLGIKIIIDDFGTGVASIDFLRDLKPEYIKFDMSYVLEVTKSEESRQILMHMSELAKACGTAVCIKGVENKETEDIVRQYAINVVQGFLYSEAVDADVILEKWI